MVERSGSGSVTGIIEPVAGIYEASSWLNLMCVVGSETRLRPVDGPEYAECMV